MSSLPLSPELMLLAVLALTVAMQCSFFALAFRFQVDKLTDFAGTLNFAAVALLSLLIEGEPSTRAIVASCLLFAWALRLGGHLVVRVLRRGRDERFDEMRSNCLAFFGFWVFQMLWVFIVSLPVVLVNSTPSNVDFGRDARDYIGVVVWSVGFLVEWAADDTKERFYRRPKTSTTTSNSSNNSSAAATATTDTSLPNLLNEGVWRYSRHPNYFGEILCWVGLTVLAAPNFDDHDHRWAYVSVVSPTFTFVLLMLLSGVPLAEDRLDERFGPQPAYLEYKESTSPLVCLPPALYRPLPLWFKRTLLFEWPMYSRKLRQLQQQEGEDKQRAQDLEDATPVTQYQSIP